MTLLKTKGWAKTSGGLKVWQGGKFPEPSDHELAAYLTDAARAAIASLQAELDRLRYVDEWGFLHDTSAAARRHWKAGETCETCSEGRRITDRIREIERRGGLS